ncbi:hypothetical protein [Polynucleobacter sp. MWH-Aus1W21]|nr:hypothetical protein [Polynucleobacter sp. MWH-Aus1W21]QWD65701.1 hypothetical protein ICW03_08575 [Polynucleobacter sp. MWH-Aus1W21]
MAKSRISRRKFLITGSALAAIPTFGVLAQEKPVFRGLKEKLRSTTIYF